MSLLLLLSVCVAFSLLSSSCSRRGFAMAPVTEASSDTEYVPFTKALKERLAHDNIDIRKVQFYISQKLVMKHIEGGEKGRVEDGVILLDHSAPAAVTIPEFTPGVCEKVSGDNVYVSFDAPGKTLEFGSGYSNSVYMLTGTNWRNGVADISYEGQNYTAECGSCSNVADVRILVRKNQVFAKDDNSRVVLGRRVNQ